MTGPRQPAVIVGAGLAGMLTALSLDEPCILVCPSLTAAQSSTGLAQGGVAAAIGAGDDAMLHLADTLAAGDGLVQADAAGSILGGAAAAIARLARLGVRFDRDADGAPALGLEAAHARRRIVHAFGDGTGAEIHRALAAAVRQAPHIRLAEGHRVRRLRTEDGRIVGLWLDDTFVPTARIVLATGGVGGLFLATTNPAGSTGAGLALGLRAGAQVRDPEFVQFHPTALDCGRFPLPLISEAVRGEGAILVDEDGRRFMADVPGAELAPRDVVARAIHAEIVLGRRVYLDARGLCDGAFAERFPAIAAICHTFGVDPSHDPIPVRPAVHYHMGGLATDLSGRTTVPGLWAVGEVASTGLHGANRLASNSLLEAAVMAPRVADSVAGAPAHSPVGDAAPSVDTGDAALEQVRRILGRDLALIRDEAGLTRAVTQLLPLAETSDPVLVGLAMAVGAFERRESRGGHWRSDYPAQAAQARHTCLDISAIRTAAEHVAQPLLLTA
ncbi:L-aspartate oxidase [Aureimonas altamirensis]|uniref:L-aspartate oxidase n=1 Tax=Aureimonas altamirensis TaxID=370622 RepID=UPI001E578142|nr:L-aspartate oxidase [Aureimonas altamirensis]UHD45151.1 L-aspartate oxidase [Aureimonas altamirensis]